MWFENQAADVILLQETHSTKSKITWFKSSWKGSSHCGVTESPFSKGVGILFRENLDVKVNECINYQNGRAVLLKFNAEIYSKKCTIVSIYAPKVEQQRSIFFKDVNTWIAEKATAKNDVMSGQAA